MNAAECNTCNEIRIACDEYNLYRFIVLSDIFCQFNAVYFSHFYIKKQDIILFVISIMKKERFC